MDKYNLMARKEELDEQIEKLKRDLDKHEYEICKIKDELDVQEHRLGRLEEELNKYV